MKVIFIISFPPAYKNINKNTLDESLLSDPYRVSDSGDKIYFFKQDWGGIIGEHVQKADPSIEWEIWRPDNRTDRELSHTFEDGLVCRSFPVSKRVSFYGLKPINLTYSKKLEARLIQECEDHRDLVILLPTTVEFSRILHSKIKSLTSKVLYYHFLNPEFLLPQFLFNPNPIKLLHRTLINLQKSFRLKYVTNMQVISESLKDDMAKLYPEKRVFQAGIGIDLSFWRNVMTKDEARSALGIADDEFVFLLSQRLVPEYQVDRWLEALSKVSGNYLCFITGTGESNYVDYLTGLVTGLKLTDQVRFVGFIPNVQLRSYITACDCFVVAAKKGGGSTGSIYAMNMQRLVLHTDSGVSYDILRKFKAGVTIKTDIYKDWASIIESLVERRIDTNLVPVDYISDLFNWDVCARQWLTAIRATRGL